MLNMTLKEFLTMILEEEMQDSEIDLILKCYAEGAFEMIDFREALEFSRKERIEAMS